MGVVLTEYGQYAYDHEGYVAEVLDDGSLTRTASSDTVPRMVGQMVAACGCGWTGKTRYPTKSPFDHKAEELALAEWERNHARPALDSGRVKNWNRLGAVLRSAPHLLDHRPAIHRPVSAAADRHSQRDIGGTAVCH
jgi:hypothetical protein